MYHSITCKKYCVLALALLALASLQCKQQAPKEQFAFAKKAKPERKQASKIVNLENRGIGPVDTITLSATVDPAMASRGQSLYEQKCHACHKIGETFIGPPPDGILERRTPEWVMNMMLNPEEMLKKDTLAKALFMDFDGQLMTNQQLTVEEARAILEYFRTLDAQG